MTAAGQDARPGCLGCDAPAMVCQECVRAIALQWFGAVAGTPTPAPAPLAGCASRGLPSTAGTASSAGSSNIGPCSDRLRSRSANPPAGPEPPAPTATPRSRQPLPVPADPNRSEPSPRRLCPAVLPARSCLPGSACSCLRTPGDLAGPAPLNIVLCCCEPDYPHPFLLFLCGGWVVGLADPPKPQQARGGARPKCGIAFRTSFRTSLHTQKAVRWRGHRPVRHFADLPGRRRAMTARRCQRYRFSR
jgi:hypothetical protein